ncbi:hypothetical protein KKG52_01115 [Patescibacteria group bacterium]|nr:hypothetical protein [Patescibacteria group bacterium]
MKKTAQIKIFTLSTFTLSLLIVPVFAQGIPETTRNMTISPPAIEKTLSPGDKTEGILKIINDGTNELVFTVSVQDYIVEDAKGTPVFLPEDTLSNKYSAANWIAVIPRNITVKPKEKIELNYYLQIPQDARPGGHYAGIIFKPTTTMEVKGTGAAVNTQIGSLFYVNIKGPISESAGVAKFFSNWFNEYGPVKLSTQIKNNGDLHITPQGKITVTNIFGQKVETQELSSHNIFPGGVVRDFENSVGRKWMFGPYKASLLASYGVNNNLPLSATVTFWVIPWKIILLVVLTTAAVALGVLYLKKRKKKAKLAELSKQHQE